MKIPVIIPARAGSKGIPGKNIMDFCGKPLLGWSILQARASESVSNVYVSTDGAEIADVADSYGANVIHRPAEFATDTATSEEALKHAISEIEKSETFDSVVFLQATSPIRRKNDISDAIRVYREGRYDSLFSATVLEDCCLWKTEDGILKSISYDYQCRGRRQDRKPVFWENGSIYIFNKNLLFNANNRLGGKIGIYSMPMECTYQIDSRNDVEVATFFMHAILESGTKVLDGRGNVD